LNQEQTAGCFGDFDGDGETELAIELEFEEMGGLVSIFGFDGTAEIYRSANSS
jgi:hypothetical protein